MDVAIVRVPDTYAYNDIDLKEEVIAGYAAAFLEAAGMTWHVYDMKLDRSLTATHILRDTPKLIAICVRHPGDTLFYSRRLARSLRRMQLNAQTHITLFGHSNVGIEESLRKHGIDTVVTGEEADLVSLAHHVVHDAEESTVTGVARLTVEGTVKYIPPAQLADLSSFPWPKRYYLDRLKVDQLSTDRVSASIQTSRGCYAACNFCFLESEKLAHGGRYPWRDRPLQDVICEIEHIIAEYGITDFYFYDTDFFGPGRRNRARYKEFSDLVKSRGIDISFFLYARADDLTEDAVASLKEVGLIGVFIGIESFSQAVLDRYNKRTTSAENLRAVALCRDYDLFVHTGYITYDYYTTFDELRETVAGWQAALGDAPHIFPSPQFLFTVLAPLDGTPIAAQYQASGLLENGLRYPFPSWILPDLRMKSPLGVYCFKEPMVARMAECTRLASYEFAKKTVKVHKALATLVASYGQVDSLPSDAEGLVSWLSVLSVHALDLFEEALNWFEAEGDLNEGIERMYARCQRFYAEYLPHELCDLETYDRHYRKLRQRESGFVEESWEGLLDQSTT